MRPEYARQNTTAWFQITFTKKSSIDCGKSPVGSKVNAPVLTRIDGKFLATPIFAAMPKSSPAFAELSVLTESQEIGPNFAAMRLLFSKLGPTRPLKPFAANEASLN